MYWKFFTLKNTFNSSNSGLIFGSSYRFFGSKSISRNQLMKIDSTLTRSNYINISILNRSLSTTNVLAKGSFTRMSNHAIPTGPMIAIRREDASIWERRSPLAPHHACV